ncbi:MAG: KR domain-containing protein, partial [Deltaproteobacteria bacterium]|nr:KR domain-containing protein [Deltaproteobacteria bacterium]
MKTYLITGGTGFLGENVARQLARRDGARVVVMA